MNNKKIEQDDEIIQKYTELDLKNHFMITKVSNDEAGNSVYLYKEIRNEILKVNSDLNYVVDVLVEYLYVHKKANYKTTLWECFGDVIIENLNKNIAEDTMLCEVCGERIDKSINNQSKYCEDCWKEKEKKLRIEINKRYYEKNKEKIKTV